MSDIRFNLNDVRATALELVGCGAMVTGGTSWGHETTPTWINGRLRFVLDEEGVSPLQLTGTLDLGTAGDHFDLEVDGRRYEVNPGESFFYSSRLPHRWMNEGKEDVEVVWVVSPPSW